ncbi:MAG: hypothetical protein J6J60_08630 [Clostridia bacterium]|nr:hypothetical protein [Clostridia bacterium]
MKDKRKIVFVVICLIIIIASEYFMFKKAKAEDELYKNEIKEILAPIELELNARGFASDEDNNIGHGILEYERNNEFYDYGYIKICYDLEKQISDISIKLEYSNQNYSDDIFSDVYYIFNLVGVDLYEEEYLDALNILTEGTKSEQIDDKISKSEIYINDEKYTVSLKKVKEKIQFCLE